MIRRKSIQLNPVEYDTLARLYVDQAIATDRYMHRRTELLSLTATFNGLTGRQDTPEDILHYMQTKRRKRGRWPTLNGTHRRFPLVLGTLVEGRFADVLCMIYKEFRCGPEVFVQDTALSIRLERRFEEETGVRKRGRLLATALIELRKEGRLPKHGPQDDGFNDFDEAEKNMVTSRC